MLFIIFVMLSAFLLEGLGTWISVLGLSALFAGSPIVIAMAVSLDIAKVAGVTFLYKNWTALSFSMKAYMTTATFVLMMITSAGVFGYLSGEFQKAISGNNQQTVLIDSLTEEKARLQKRKEEIDAQIANLPANAVTSRVRLTKQFNEESTGINQRLTAIDKQLPELKVNAIGQNTKIGPIMYVAEVFGTTPEQAVKWVILVIIFVFDPLAIALLVAGNFLLARRKEEMQIVQPQVVEKEIVDEPKVVESKMQSVIPQISPWKFSVAAPVAKQIPSEPKAPKKVAKKRVYKRVAKPVKPEIVEGRIMPEPAKETPEIITMQTLKANVHKSSLDDNDYPVGQITYPDIPVRQMPPPPLPRTSMDDVNPASGDIQFSDDTSTKISKVYNRD